MFHLCRELPLLAVANASGIFLGYLATQLEIFITVKVTEMYLHVSNLNNQINATR